MHAEVVIAGQAMHLLPERAMFWPARSTLLIADTHFGKDAAFRHAGIPVPQESLQADVQRLTSIVRQTCCDRLIVLGDFYHARSGRSDHTEARLADWFDLHSQLDVVIVEGNHDVHAGPPPLRWDIRYEPRALHDPPFVFVHETDDATTCDAAYRIGGHVHPVVQLRGPARSSRRAACFVIGADHAVLPAFARFTGGKAVRPAPGTTIWPMIDGVMASPITTDGMRARRSG